MNQFMMNNGQMPNLPTTKELWKEEKSKYRIWMILYPLSLIAVFGMMLTSVILYFTNEASVNSSITNYIFTDSSVAGRINILQAKNSADSFSLWYLKFSPIAVLAIIGTSFGLFITSIFKAYKDHNFGIIPTWATSLSNIVGFIAMFSFMRLGYYMTSIQGKLIFTSQLLGIVISIFSFFVGKIIKLFAYADKMEKMQQDPAFQSMQQQIKDFIDFKNGNRPTPSKPTTPVNASSKNPSVHPTGVGPATQAPNKPLISKEKQMLHEMDISTLQVIAKKYSISGSNKMSKDELIETILRISGKQ